MAKIRILPDVLAHKIAAGEVVERPASVVKELLENALDASAGRVEVSAQGGGRRSIRVRDDGSGMSAEDARLAFRHHATSKIHSFDDLSHIRTLGFRGEALPSIASVTRLRLRTAERDTGAESAGTEIYIEGGQVKDSREVVWAKGTEVFVEDLFFNVPARRKFLKSTPTELHHLSRQVMHYALARPEVEFRLEHGGRELIQAPAVDRLEDRVYQILGESFLHNLVPVEYERDGVRVTGFTSLPHEQRSNSQTQFMYVNGRMVRDRILMHAVKLAYQDLIPSGTYPVLVLFVNLDPVEVDVNVHPSKTEIRFRNSQAAHRAVHRSLEAALLGKGAALGDIARELPSDRLELPATGQAQKGVERSMARFLDRQNGSGSKLLPSGQYSAGGTASLPVPGNGASGAAHAADIPVTDYLSPVPVVLGQFVESFVVVADREGVMLVDQHVAHERILYDLALDTLKSSKRCPIQRLLVPLTYELNAQQRATVNEIKDELNANGFEVEWFGERTLVIKGVPSFALDCDARVLIEEILDGFATARQQLEDRDGLVARLREKIAIGSSCHGAIKINTPLSGEKMQWLLDELFRCDNPFTCPHGRPIVLRLGIEDVLRGFKRI